MKKHLLVTIISLIFLNHYSTAGSLSAEEIIDKSVTFHDPSNNWHKLHARFMFVSKFKNNPFPTENLAITINNPKNEFKYQNIQRNFEASFTPNNCKTISKTGDCNNYTWTKNFYTYVWGLPMKLKDTGVKIDSSYTTEVLHNQKCYKVSVQYPAENYFFYFRCSDFELVAFSFLKNDSSGHGEFVEMSGKYIFNNITFPRKRVCKELVTKKILGENSVINIK